MPTWANRNRWQKFLTALKNCGDLQRALRMARLTEDEFNNCVNTNPRRLREYWKAELIGKARQRVLGDARLCLDQCVLPLKKFKSMILLYSKIFPAIKSNMPRAHAMLYLDQCITYDEQQRFEKKMRKIGEEHYQAFMYWRERAGKRKAWTKQDEDLADIIAKHPAISAAAAVGKMKKYGHTTFTPAAFYQFKKRLPKVRLI